MSNIFIDATGVRFAATISPGPYKGFDADGKTFTFGVTAGAGDVTQAGNNTFTGNNEFDLTAATFDISAADVGSGPTITISGVPSLIATASSVLSVVGGASISSGADVASIVNLTLVDNQTIDGVDTSTYTDAPAVVLVKNQTDPIENGLYLAGDGAWTRFGAYPGGGFSDGATTNFGGRIIQVVSGLTQAGKQFFVNAPVLATQTVGTDALNFVAVA